MAEQYLEGLIFRGGKLQTNMPESRQLVYMDAKYMKFVVEFNNTRAGVVQEAIDALAPYLK
jgi:hypothetical protein